MSEMQVPLYTSFKSNNMDIIYFEKNYSLPLTMAPPAEQQENPLDEVLEKGRLII